MTRAAPARARDHQEGGRAQDDANRLPRGVVVLAIALAAGLGIVSPAPWSRPWSGGFEIGAGERDDLIAFLEALTDTGFLTAERCQSPFRRRGDRDQP